MTSVPWSSSTAKKVTQQEDKEHRVEKLRQEYFKLKAVSPQSRMEQAQDIKRNSSGSRISFQHAEYDPDSHFTTEYRKSTGSPSNFLTRSCSEKKFEEFKRRSSSTFKRFDAPAKDSDDKEFWEKMHEKRIAASQALVVSKNSKNSPKWRESTGHRQSFTLEQLFM